MDCREAGGKLEMLALDGLSAPETAAVEDHLRACAKCRALARRYDFLADLIKGSAAPEAPGEEAWKAVSGEIRRQQAGLFRRRAARVVASVAALALVAFALWSLLRPNAQTPPRPTEKWACSGLRTQPRSPAYDFTIAGNRLFALCDHGEAAFACAFDAVSGERLWRTEEPSEGYLSARGGVVYALRSASSDAVELVALDAAAGRVLWRHEAPEVWQNTRVRPLPLDRGRVCWTSGQTVLMLDSRTGNVLWRHRIADEGPLSRVARDGDQLLVATGQALHGVSPDEGRRLWRKETGEGSRGLVRPLLASAAGRAYLVHAQYSPRAQVRCVDIRTRETVWSRQAGQVARLLAAGDEVYVRGRQVTALDGRTGRPLWSFAAEGCGAMTAGGGIVRFVDAAEDGGLIALDARTGRIVWEVPGVKSCDPFVTCEDTGYIKTGQGLMLAIALPEDLRS